MSRVLASIAYYIVQGTLPPADAAGADTVCCVLGDHSAMYIIASRPHCSILGPHRFSPRSLPANRKLEFMAGGQHS